MPGASARSTCSMAITDTTLVYPGRLVLAGTEPPTGS